MSDMNRDMDSRRLERIAFTMVTSRSQKARRRVLGKHIGPGQLCRCSTAELKILGFSDEGIRDIKTNYTAIAEEEVEKASKSGIDIIFKEDEYYPPLLGEIFDPPDFIYAKGDKEILKSEKLAVVGSRKGSTYGWQSINRILPGLCAAGITVVSGMAYGIDSMAHKVTLRENGSTIGVNAGGLLHLYPAGNTGLIRQIIEKGCVISEFALDLIPRPFYFPIRNRIIAGISRAVMVVEAALRSGSLITARLGLEQDRYIFAVPGRIDSPVSQGTNYLIQQGGKLIASAKDILDEYGLEPVEEKKAEIFEFSKKEQQILELMEDNEVKSVDYFVERLDEFSVSSIISSLMGLVLKNVLIEESGGYKRSR